MYCAKWKNMVEFSLSVIFEKMDTFLVLILEDPVSTKYSNTHWNLLREKCPNTEFFLVLIFQHSVWIHKNTDQKNFVFGNFSRSEKLTANGASCFFSTRPFFKETDQVLFTTFEYFHCSFNIFNPLMQKLPKWSDTLKILQEKLQIFQSVPGHFGHYAWNSLLWK